MIYSIPYQTRWHDTDANRQLRPSQLLVYMQETSNQHVAHVGMTLDELRDRKHLAFILSKIRLAFYRPLYAFEDIEVQTWTTPGRGYSSCRCFRILRGDEVIAEADSTWALINTETRQLCKPEETGYPFENEEALTLDVPNRIRFPSDCVPEEVAKRKIVYSDLDYNMHMNNTRYPDMLCDYLPLDTVGKIRGMTLSYLHEAAYGNTITVLRAQKDNVYYFRTLNEEGTVCLEAQIVTE
ncbi:MAG: hypothetical protein IJW44_03590 [Clostridia bacterium]|nr:hypothetical protein [Clostridia bacterium]